MISKKLYLSIFTTLLLCVVASISGYTQSVGLNNTGFPADPSAVLDINSTVNGLKLPNLTKAQRIAIAAPAKGLTVYQTDEFKGVYYYNGTTWLRWLKPDPLHGTVVMNSTNVPAFTSNGAITFSGAIAGELTVNFPVAPQVPTILLSNNVGLADPPAPSSYCQYVFTSPCNTGAIDEDYAEQVTIEMIIDGITPVVAPYYYNRNNTGCEGPAIGNYVLVNPDPALPVATIQPDQGPLPLDKLKITVRDNALWGDNMRVWIDYNRDGDFYDLGELFHVHTGAGGQNPAAPTLTSSNIPADVPSTASNGVTFMRVKNYWIGQSTDPCIGGTWGETEDYRILIANATAAPAPEIATACIVKSVTTSSFRVVCTALSGIAKKNTTIHFQITEN
jgi:GEVED domain